ncbi:signal peptidase I [Piscirickettsia salmonis]|uniref:signal peptidase I n=1 Tax=Piscirickettsia salmonis TaxID=1238 RepID=UPI003EBAC504
MMTWILLILTALTGVMTAMRYIQPALADNKLITQAYGAFPLVLFITVIYVFHGSLANNFDWILVSLTLITGALYLLDLLLWKKARVKQEMAEPKVVEYARGFFPVFLVVLVIRSFIVSPSVVPSGSLLPTLDVGDYVLANNFAYGVRLPLSNLKIISVGEPKRGDIALFHWPVNPQAVFIKRVVGVPGDVVSYHNKVLTINGKVATQKFLSPSQRVYTGGGQWINAEKYSEDLLGIQHNIYVIADRPAEDFANLVIPKGYYLMMGDDRDDSDDGRGWGLVPEKDFIGKAWRRFFSWDSINHRVRWDRIATLIH